MREYEGRLGQREKIAIEHLQKEAISAKKRGGSLEISTKRESEGGKKLRESSEESG